MKLIDAGFLPWKVLHLHLEQPLPALECDPAIGGLFVVFWLDDRPVGELKLHASRLGLTAAGLSEQAACAAAAGVAEVLRHRKTPQAPSIAEKTLDGDLIARPGLLLAQAPILTSPARSPADSVPALTVCVAICTRDRPDMLRRSIEMIGHLTVRPTEVVVVDNNPASGQTRAVTDDFPQVRYLPEPRPGLSIARNTAITRSKSEVIVFTDDDAEVHSHWLERLLPEFSDPEVGCVTGLMLPAELDTAAQCWFQGVDEASGWSYVRRNFDKHFMERNSRRGCPVWKIGAGVSMAIRRSTLDAVGLFDERLGAGAAGCSEDSEFWYRVIAHGQSCVYTPAAVVFHHHRRDAAGLRRQMHDYLRGHVAALLIQFANHGHWGNLLRAVFHLPAYFLLLPLFDLLHNIRTPRLLGPRLSGLFAGFGYSLRHVRKPPHAPVVDSISTLPSS